MDDLPHPNIYVVVIIHKTLIMKLVKAAPIVSVTIAYQEQKSLHVGKGYSFDRTTVTRPLYFSMA